MNFAITIGSREFKVSLGKKPTPAPRRRSFNSAAINRLTNDWLSPQTSPDAELLNNVRTIRGRCRQLERNNDYIRRYLKLVENNVLGADGIGLQMKSQDQNGQFDKQVNDIIEAGWRKWGRKATCSLSQLYSWRRMERLILRSAVRDGGVLLRPIATATDDNPFGFTLQPLEIDHLDHDYNAVLANGNEIRMGIEIATSGRVVRYYILEQHPGENYQPRRRRIPIDASDLLHISLPERVGQSVGLPFAISSMLGLQMLEGYQEAELVAAREGACKGGFIQKETPDNFPGDGTDAEGNNVFEMEPGVVRELDPGQTFVEHDPKHPNTAYPDFVKAVLRQLASGLGVSYNSLANDLEGVNYSSIRAGLLDEREEWKALQCWLIEELHEPVFERWLELSLAFGALKTPSGAALPASRFEKFNMPEWKPRRWPWVDPEKDIKANVIAVEKGFSSRRRIIAEQGGDVEDVFQEQAEDNKLATKYGLEFPTDVQPVDNSASVDGREPEQED